MTSSDSLLQELHVCDGIASTLSTNGRGTSADTLSIRRKQKDTTQYYVSRLIHAHVDIPYALLRTLRDTYTSPGIPTTLPSYTGQPNPELDTDKTEAEVRAALLTLRTNSAPAPTKSPTQRPVIWTIDRSLASRSTSTTAGRRVPYPSPGATRMLFSSISPTNPLQSKTFALPG
ncbi:hypothetical protein HPB49_021435 [Dermacentor silvarum]|uniref:Uncharacterized protein n=1 Tax=Dermacentor silvarum TaxID=543639 RepID=A0ACB8CMY4_DERSI|nr:hypothetical protein HPB49_021435 [Dermacentor silvarum]